MKIILRYGFLAIETINKYGNVNQKYTNNKLNGNNNIMQK